uniref:Uncharacterized protein n=1 Tax=Plectus sambesii TaxID=2011161 RepID=A0A914UZH1_9BILA
MSSSALTLLMCTLLTVALIDFNLALFDDNEGFCPYCNLAVCQNYCYTTKHGLRGAVEDHGCGELAYLRTLVVDADLLISNATNSLCQKSRQDEKNAVCWCRTSIKGNQLTEDELIRSIRIIRYQSVLEEMRQSSAATGTIKCHSLAFGQIFFAPSAALLLAAVYMW